MTTIVTGATGQVGLELVRALDDRGHAVRAITLPGDPVRLPERVEVVHADVRDLDRLEEAFAGGSAVYHLAAVVTTRDDDPLVWAVNVDGARNAALAARNAGVQRFVHFSSMVVFDPAPRDEPLDETRARNSGSALSPYLRSKLQGEVAVREQIAAGLDAVIVHPTVVVGPNERHHDGIVRNLIARHREGRLPALIDGGFNLVDVLDVVDGAISAQTRGRTGENYILGGHWYTVREFVDLSASMVGVPAPKIRLPLSLARAALPWLRSATARLGMPAPFNAEELNQLEGNPDIRSDKAIRELGYRPRPITGALARVHAWLDEAG